MSVSIEHDDCLGCEACVEICPEVFEFNDDEVKAYVKEDADENSDCIDEAIGSCPADCIIKD